jgi:hypothetical protein
MTAATVTTTRTLDTTDLAAAGFSAEQIANLVAFKQSYSPFGEHFDSDREFRQVSFLKWQYENGQVRG